MRAVDVDSEWRVLTTDEGRALLAEVQGVPAPGPAELQGWRRRIEAGLVSAALRLADCRRRAAGKFARADQMWLDPVGLEQSTAEPVARHKAARFVGAGVVDLCCGIGGDTLALAATAEGVIAVDRDPGMARRALWNAAAHDAGARVAAVAARAEGFGVPAGFRLHVDPDRRAAGGGRARRIDDYSPNLAGLRALMATARGGAVKLGPASDFEATFGSGGCEVELVSLGGECKEATAWFGDLATCRRRASRLPTGATWTDRDGPSGRSVGIAAPAAFVFDPDPALIRAGLLDGFALVQGLDRLGPGIDLLTGPTPLESPWLARFAVLDVLPVDRKRLRRVVSERELGPLEIKVRGLDVSPVELRATLRPPGTNAATLIVYANRGAGAIALLAERR